VTEKPINLENHNFKIMILHYRDTSFNICNAIKQNYRLYVLDLLEQRISNSVGVPELPTDHALRKLCNWSLYRTL